ncbi:unnamed protein product [Cylindrotheca closterium]|uniref:CASTOR ACT domain-containing protein n=1 Tax=Cylindrotheca closterium TaxID=2856 RepID=A0AAD2FJ66_9STRA|nr:unnamed protein product [Cylindrotheca closterium]
MAQRRCLQKISCRFVRPSRQQQRASIGGGNLGARIPNTKVASVRGFATATDVAANSVPAAKTLPEAFRNSTLCCDDRNYTLVRFPTSSMGLALQLWNHALVASTLSNTTTATTTTTTTTAPSKPPPSFGGFLVDKDEITMLVPSDVYTWSIAMNNMNKTTGKQDDSLDAGTDNGIKYRLFTFDDVVLHPSLVGFMAVITRALADHDISVLPYAAYSTDHIFVAEKDATKTRSILEGLPEYLSKDTDGNS